MDCSKTIVCNSDSGKHFDNIAPIATTRTVDNARRSLETVDVWIESICTHMQSVTEIEINWSKETTSNQCFQIPSVFEQKRFRPSDMPSFPLVPRCPLPWGRLCFHLAKRGRTGPMP